MIKSHKKFLIANSNIYFDVFNSLFSFVNQNFTTNYLMHVAFANVHKNIIYMLANK